RRRQLWPTAVVGWFVLVFAEGRLAFFPVTFCVPHVNKKLHRALKRCGMVPAMPVFIDSFF
ncbi:hypothetical protein ACUSKT_004818, partial [Salmonella enterica subsp. enterica serovar Montevideo]